MRGIHRWPVNSPLKGPVTRKMLPFDDVIMYGFAIHYLVWRIIIPCSTHYHSFVINGYSVRWHSQAIRQLITSPSEMYMRKWHFCALLCVVAHGKFKVQLTLSSRLCFHIMLLAAPSHYINQREWFHQLLPQKIGDIGQHTVHHISKHKFYDHHCHHISVVEDLRFNSGV